MPTTLRDKLRLLVRLMLPENATAITEFMSGQVLCAAVHFLKGRPFSLSLSASCLHSLTAGPTTKSTASAKRSPTVLELYAG
jgi:hypothetical protein